MKIIAADDEQSALNILKRAISQAVPDAEIHPFNNAQDIIDDIKESGFAPDVAFLDIEMPGTTGLELARVLKIICPKLNIIFVTGYSKYALEALTMRPSGYLTKPVTKEDICTEMQNLRNPPARTVPAKRIRIQCFGGFDVFVDGEVLRFPRAKCKELLAYLVDRRDGCSATEIADALWDDGIYDRSRQKQLSVIRSDLLKALKAVDAEAVLTVSRDFLAVNPAAFDCDYYMMLAGDSVAINSFTGEYMRDYSWAEFTTASISERFSQEDY